jgi:GTP cyclohydrolase I
MPDRHDRLATPRMAIDPTRNAGASSARHAPHDHGANGHDHDPAPAAPPGVGIARRDAFDAPAFERAVTDLLRACGLAPDAAHMGRTPQRVRELWQRRLLGGYDLDPATALGDGFADTRDDLVVIRGIAVHGVCPHHLVPFRGVAHVGYLPGGRLHGFGRIARMVDAIGHRFTYQEWMTRDVAEALVVHGHARGAACVIEAEQLCLLLGEDRRGDERVVTQAFVGSFQHSDRDRAEFLRAIEPHGR